MHPPLRAYEAVAVTPQQGQQLHHHSLGQVAWRACAVSQRRHVNAKREVLLVGRRLLIPRLAPVGGARRERREKLLVRLRPQRRPKVAHRTRRTAVNAALAHATVLRRRRAGGRPHDWRERARKAETAQVRRRLRVPPQL